MQLITKLHNSLAPALGPIILPHMVAWARVGFGHYAKNRTCSVFGPCTLTKTWCKMERQNWTLFGWCRVQSSCL